MPAPDTRDTFCALPFAHLDIDTDGRARLCCRATGHLTSEGRPLSVRTNRLLAIWNSAPLRQARLDMLAGRDVAACAACYQAEADGARSMRQSANADCAELYDVETAADFRREATRRTGASGAIAEAPAWETLWLGNLCNLTCRMCGAHFSSAIAADPVHARWSRGLSMAPLPDGPDWAASDTLLRDTLLAQPERLRRVEFSGGEPLVNPRLPHVLDLLLHDGHGAHITVHVNSNGTVYSSRLSGLLRRFAGASIAFSLDGVGPLQEYIRPPSRWDIVCRNVLAFAADGIAVSIQPTPQAYNVFGLLELVRFWDERGIPVGLDNIIRGSHLGLDMLPASITREALREWQGYRETIGDDVWKRGQVDALLSALGRPRPPMRRLLQDLFVRFTNDLDASRGQSLQEANPRLYRALVDAGCVFRGKHLFVGETVVPRIVRRWPRLLPRAGALFRRVRG